MNNKFLWEIKTNISYLFGGLYPSNIFFVAK